MKSPEAWSIDDYKEMHDCVLSYFKGKKMKSLEISFVRTIVPDEDFLSAKRELYESIKTKLELDQFRF